MNKQIVQTRDGKIVLETTYDAAELTAQFYENRNALQAIDARIAELQAALEKGQEEIQTQVAQLTETRESIEWFIANAAPVLDKLKKEKK